jgi:integrase
LFLAEAKRSSPHYLLYVTAILTGMRQGELLALRWRHVDLLLGTITVQQTLCRLGREVTFKEPKTPKSRRTIAVPPLLHEVLRQARGKASDDALVFCQPNGKPLHGHNITRRDLREVLKRAKVPRLRFHDLRHAHASHLLKQGVPVKVVQERLGHATPAVTLGIYAHVLPHMQEQAARQLEAQLLGSLLKPGDSRG